MADFPIAVFFICKMCITKSYFTLEVVRINFALCFYLDAHLTSVRYTGLCIKLVSDLRIRLYVFCVYIVGFFAMRAFNDPVMLRYLFFQFLSMISDCLVHLLFTLSVPCRYRSCRS